MTQLIQYENRRFALLSILFAKDFNFDDTICEKAAGILYFSLFLSIC